jgi:hypothetical protein
MPIIAENIEKDLINTSHSYSNSIYNRTAQSNSGTGNSSNPGMQGAVANMSAYQSAQALGSKSQGMLTQAKSVIPTNATSATKAAVAKLDVDLSQLKKTTPLCCLSCFCSF